jgi:hypothetical protein
MVWVRRDQQLLLGFLHHSGLAMELRVDSHCWSALT